jgi:hypothetical protein
VLCCGIFHLQNILTLKMFIGWGESLKVGSARVNFARAEPVTSEPTAEIDNVLRVYRAIKNLV